MIVNVHVHTTPTQMETQKEANLSPAGYRTDYLFQSFMESATFGHTTGS